MNINFDVMQLGFLFLPGLLARIILGKILFYREKTSFNFLLSSFILGVFSYCLVFVGRCAVHTVQFGDLPAFTDIPFAISSASNASGVDLYEVFYALLASFVAVAVIAYAETNKLVHRLALRLKMTNRFAEPDVWGYALDNNSLNTSEWANIRNKKHNVMYQGRVLAFSDSYREAEILLSDVSVYKNREGTLLYNVDMVYLTLEPGDIEMELYRKGDKGNGEAHSS